MIYCYARFRYRTTLTGETQEHRRPRVRQSRKPASDERRKYDMTNTDLSYKTLSLSLSLSFYVSLFVFLCLSLSFSVSVSLSLLLRTVYLAGLRALPFAIEGKKTRVRDISKFII